MRRRSVIYNYIPYKKQNIDIIHWYESYEKDLINLYVIQKEIMTEMYPNNNIDWDDEKVFNKFINVIYYTVFLNFNIGLKLAHIYLN